jgi:dynein heavy chain 2
VELYFIFYFDQVPGMYTSEEIEALLAPLKEVATDEGYGGSLFSFYAQRA